MFKSEIPLKMKIPENPSNILWNQLDHSRKSFCKSIWLLVFSLMLTLGLYCLGILLLHAYRSNQIDSEMKVNPAVLGYCSQSTTFEEVKAKTETFLKWSVANPSLVKPSFLQNKKIIDRLEFFGISPDYDLFTLQDNPEQTYDEFMDKWDNTAQLEMCFCHWQYKSKQDSDADMSEFCGFIHNSVFKVFFVTTVSGIMITFTNILILHFLPLLVRRIPVENLTTQENISIVITLVFLYINSILAPILIHSPEFLKIFQGNLSNLESSIFPNLITFYDFDHQWYQEVGLKITISFLLNLLVCSIIEMTRVKIGQRWID